MIRYQLKCDNGHQFESWFQSAVAFDKLRGAGMVGCTDCGSTTVEKAIMAPAVAKEATAPLSTPGNDREKALAKLRTEVENNSEYVGMGFAKEARAIHTGDAPERAIYGEARTAEAIALIEEGISVTPLPFKPRRQAN